MPATRLVAVAFASAAIARAGLRGLFYRARARPEGRVMNPGPSALSATVAEWKTVETEKKAAPLG
jgi:hypothetical protein